MRQTRSYVTNSIRTEIARRSAEVLGSIREDPRLSCYVRTDKLPRVYMEAEDARDIRLVVVGQDPTVKDERSRETIETVLNLDKPRGSLHRYMSMICDGLGLDLRRHVYATNYAKGFFVRPPTQISECDVLAECRRYWLPLLRSELVLFPGRPVITLGEPLLKVLLFDPKEALVRSYWGYTQNWAVTRPTFSSVCSEANRLGRRLFPFPHQPSLRKRFYRAVLSPYLAYVKKVTLSI